MEEQTIKTAAEIAIMAQGGKMLGKIRDQLAAAVVPGIEALQLENMAVDLIKKSGGKASFKMVPGYYHATCININDVVVHGIPDKTVIGDGDKVSIDVGLFYKGFHTDTATTVVAVSPSQKPTTEIRKFLGTGKLALKKAIEQAKPGKRVRDISAAIQKTVEQSGYSAVRALSGHGVGKNLHEEPAIPCFVTGKYEHSPVLVEGMVIAIEVMYNAGLSDVAYKNDDGWTIATADGKISGLFEQTVAVTKSGPVILTGTENLRKNE